MKSKPDMNRDAFYETAKRLMDEGHVVFNPAAVEDVVSRFSMTVEQKERYAFSVEMDWLCREADAIAFLSDWENSGGSFAEWALAKRLGLKIIYL